ncbi:MULTISPECIES: DVU0524 family FlgM-associated protein [unclassified Desulfovibrio]|uniref:DVU0524 family FlgM-associated protein n=1 Tax=unclassified Desulfovibrio TaxID=2593640 RepID=UPI002FDA550D
MPDANSAKLRMMLQGYEQQLLAARRLARFRVRRRLAQGEDPNDPDPVAHRKACVEKVARELYETLIFTGSDNPVVENIRKELGKEVGQEVVFTYPPGQRLHIVGEGPDGMEPLSEDVQRTTRHALWRIIREQVDKSMLEEPPRGTDQRG